MLFSPWTQPGCDDQDWGLVRRWRVTLSRKGAKSRTRGRKLHLTGTKARVARTRQIRADLEQQLKACRREIAHAREHLVEAIKYQTGTSEVLRISSYHRYNGLNRAF